MNGDGDKYKVSKFVYESSDLGVESQSSGSRSLIKSIKTCLFKTTDLEIYESIGWCIPAGTIEHKIHKMETDVGL